MKTCFWKTLALVVGCFLFVSSLQAQEKSQEKPQEKPQEEPEFEESNQKLGYREAGPKHLQLTSFMAPVLQPGRRRAGSVPITVILKVPDEDEVGAICRVAPRIRDALMVSLFSRPIPVKRGKLELDGVGMQLMEATNKALGSDLVSEVFILAGTKSIGRGAVMNLPFSSSGCAEIRIKKK